MVSKALLALLLSFFCLNIFGQQKPTPYKVVGKENISKKVKPMPKYTSPGVYIEENSSLPISIVQSSTSITAIIGYTEKAFKTQADDLLFVPTKVHSLLEYETLFGNPPASTSSFRTYDALKLFFDNGGSSCYIVSVGNYSDSIELGSFSGTGLLNGLKSLEKTTEPTILISPDAVELKLNEQVSFYQSMLNHCQQTNRFSIFDLKEPKPNMQDPVSKFRDAIGTNHLEFGAIYTPWLVTASGAKTPPSGAIAGVYANTDRTRGVWKAPANVSLNSVFDVSQIISSRKQESLNVDPIAGKSINAIRKFSGKGILVWGSRTLAGNDNEWRYIPVRRFASMLESSIENGLESFSEKENNSSTWAEVKSSIENFMVNQWRSGALNGTSTNEAFFVKVGVGETMTVQDIQDGKMIVEVGFAPIRPSEFIILKFIQDLK